MAGNTADELGALI